MRNINWLGLIICGICVSASLTFSVHYGLMIADTIWQAAVYSGIGVAAVIWEMVGAHRVGHLWRIGRFSAMAACIWGLGLATFITVQYELGYLAYMFEGSASVGESRAGERAALEAERARLEAQIAKSGISRPAEAVKGDLKRLEELRGGADRAKHEAAAEEARGGCGVLCAAHKAEYEGAMSRIARAPARSDLEAELGTALALAGASARIDTINAKLKPLAANGVADARATYMGQAFNISDQTARAILAMLIIVFLYCGRTWSPFVFMDAKAATSSEAVGYADSAAEGPVALSLELAGVPSLPAGVVGIESQAEPEFFAPPYDNYEDDEADNSEYAEALFDMSEAEMLAQLPKRQPLTKPVIEKPKVELNFQQSRIRSLVQRFIDECCVIHPGDHSVREGAQTMQDAFKVWIEDSEIVDSVSKNDFGQYMTSLLQETGGDKIKSDSWWYAGVSLTPAHAHRVARKLAESDDSQEAAQSDAGGRLGRAGRERRSLIFENIGTA